VPVEAALKGVRNLGFTEQELLAILSDNATDLLGL
jgi:predicted TIM-barrel fold metal-dependent hydrolase